jgi:hypothetical protein
MKRRIVEVIFAEGGPYWSANKSLWRGLGKPDGSDRRYNLAMKYADDVSRIKVSMNASRSAKRPRNRGRTHRAACIDDMRNARQRAATFKEWWKDATSRRGNGTLTILPSSKKAVRFSIFFDREELDEKKSFGLGTFRDWWAAAAKNLK